MISAAYCRLFASYNSWQNTKVITAANELSDAERWLDRGAFFKSIAATLNHLYWADALMLERIKGNERPQEMITHSLANPSDWEEFKGARTSRDAEITHWAGKTTSSDLRGSIAWYPLDGSAKVEMPKAVCVIQLFNHQTHHRGQVHAMLTAAGANLGPTDVAAMPSQMFPDGLGHDGQVSM